MTGKIGNTWQCPSCKGWIDQGTRNQRKARLTHLKACDPVMHAKQLERIRELEEAPDNLKTQGTF